MIHARPFGWIVSVALGVGSACQLAATPRDASVDGDNTVHVVEAGTVTPRLLLTGELDAAESIVLTTPRTENWSARIRWLAEDGSKVAVGDPVVRFDDTALQEKLGELRLAVSKAQSELARTRAEAESQRSDKHFAVTKAEITLAKAKLDADVSPELVSRLEYSQNQLAATKAESELATARDDLAAFDRTSRHDVELKQIELATAERRLEHAQSQINELEIKAPSDGVVIVERHFNEDRKIQAGDELFPGMPIAKLPDLSQIVVTAQLSDVDHGRLAVGTNVTATLDAYPERQFAGTVRKITPVAREGRRNGTRRFFAVEITLAEVDATIMMPGLSVLVDVRGPAHSGEVIVPRTVLDFGGATPVVHAEDGSSHEVTLGPCDTRACLVQTGIAAGDRLLARGRQL